ncbi:MAG: hypothetical protein M1812_005249 [Candelaria pacifica]|nr:MAG: hypothetical protein M1812_005249 [Candelaria pacifica]
MEDLIAQVKVYVKEYMSRYDASHDYNHVLRVLALSHQIAAQEIQGNLTPQYDSSIITLAALLHDVGDKKYTSEIDSHESVEKVLLCYGATDELARKVQKIVTHVSYSAEIKDPHLVRTLVAELPELAVVQDADRLDAIGAVGIGRAFTFGGAKRKDESMEATIDHFKEKLERLEGLMKTRTGMAMARERTQRLVMFRQWWEEESTTSRAMS